MGARRVGRGTVTWLSHRMNPPHIRRLRADKWLRAGAGGATVWRTFGVPLGRSTVEQERASEVPVAVAGTADDSSH